MRYDDATRNTVGCFTVTQSATPYTSDGLSVSGYTHAIIYAAANTGAGETITLEIEDSADNSSFAATTCPSILIDESSGLVSKSFHIKSESVRQYIRLKATLAGGAVLHGAGYVLMNQAQSNATPPTSQF